MTISLKYKRGTSVVEFLIIGPLVCLLFYAAVDLNERLDQKRFLRIASRNIAAAGIDVDVAGRQKILRNSLAHGKHTAFQDESTVANLAASSTENGSLKGGSRLNAALADVDYGTSEGDLVLSKERLEAAPEFDDKSYSKISAGEGFLTKGSRLLDGVINTRVLGYSILIPDSPRVATVRLTTAEQSSLFKRGIGLLDRSIQRKNPDEKTYSGLETDLAARFYTRSEPGYHPNDYKAQGLIGFVLGKAGEGKHWGSPYKRDSDGGIIGLILDDKPKEGFPKECMMNFTAGDQCTNTNWHSVIVLVVAEVRGIVSILHGGESGGSAAGGGAEGGMSDGMGSGMADGVGSGVGSGSMPANPSNSGSKGGVGLGDAGSLTKSFSTDFGGFMQGQLKDNSAGMQDLLGGSPSSLITDRVMGDATNPGGEAATRLGGFSNIFAGGEKP